MTLNEFFIENKIPLNEGLVIFRNSKRIRNLIKKLEKKVKGVPHEDTIAFFDDLREVADKFEKVEQRRKLGHKEEAREKYNKLKLKYADIVERINQESFKKILKVAGIIGVVALVGLLAKSILDYGEELDKSGASRFDKMMKPDDKLLDEFIARTSKKNGVPEKLVRAIIQNESGGDEHAIGYNKNGTRDLGMMQLNSQYINWMKEKFWPSGEKFDPLNPRHNIEMATKYLSYLSDRYKGNIDKIVQAYNAGPTAVDTKQVPKNTLSYLNAVKKLMG